MASGGVASAFGASSRRPHVASSLGERRGLILVFNAGSSTLKASLLRTGRERPLGAVTIEWDGDAVRDAPRAVSRALAALGDPPLDGVVGVGHRVVHGGPDLTRPVVIDEASLASIEAVAVLAPLHDPLEPPGVFLPRVFRCAQGSAAASQSASSFPCRVRR